MGTNYRKGLLLSLGSIIQTQVDLQTVIPTSKKTTGLNRVCPEHFVKLKQVHFCEHGEGHYVDEFVLAAPTATGYAVPDDAKPEIAPSDVLTLTPVPVKELDDNVIDGESRFYLAPTSPAGAETYQVIANLVEKGKIALVTKGVLRRGSKEKLWQVQAFRGTLILNEITFPDHINEPPELPEVKVSKEITGLVNTFVDGLMSTWDAIDKTDTSREQIDQWLATARQIENVQVNDPDTTAVTNLMEALKEATKK